MRYLLLLLLPNLLLSQSTKSTGAFTFHPDYQLYGNAANEIGPRIENPGSDLGSFTIQSNPLIFKDQAPTQRIINFFESQKLPKGPFTLELWMVNHVNQPIGTALLAKGKNDLENPNWLLGYFGNEIMLGVQTEEKHFQVLKSKITRGWKKYWLHVVATYDGKSAKLYFNGVQKAVLEIGKRVNYSASTEIELAGYLENEPYMEIANLVKNLNIYEQALTPEEIEVNFQLFQKQVEQGIIFQDMFHFTVGPYLHYATPTSINLTWETSEKVTAATIHYGEVLPLSESQKVNLYDDPQPESEHFIQTATIKGLKPETPYFYEIELINSVGDTIKSGTLTFATAPAKKVPFTFAVIGDTEARPHVNFQVAQLLWDERPNFVINLGDLTDGGKEPHKFEWTHEYFTGVTPIASRIPFFPVPGNGEGDLYWYNRYHKLPGAESYYTFHYGDAQFFMLNSNEKDDFAPGGIQYQWLENELKKSTAKWKFACHHHSPYSSDENDYGDSWKEKSNLGDLKVREIVPLYEKYGVDIVLFGHLHTYQRTLPIFENIIDQKNGVIYIQGGGAGGNLEDFTPNHTWFSAKTYRGHHYFTFSILDNEIAMRMYDSNGNMKDFMSLNK